ncbi:hypothetical protein AAMO2058_001395500 [Amorphochlora amoebiformis]
MVTPLWLLVLLPCAARATEAAGHFVVVVDAGSTGSRAHVFRFGPLGGAASREPTFETLGSRRIDGGIHTLVGQDEGVKKHVGELLSYIKSQVPTQYQPNTPVLLWATAGMRLITQQQADDILSIARKEIFGAGFLFRSDMARVISGSEEALFSWVAAVYLRGNWPISQWLSCEQGDCPSTVKDTLDAVRSFGVIEMGGASMQVAYPIQGEGHMDFSFGHHNMKMYAKSYLGYGMREAQKMYLNAMEDSPCHRTQKETHEIAWKAASFARQCSDTIEEHVTGSLEEISSKSAVREFYTTENFHHVLSFFLELPHPWDSEAEKLEKLEKNVKKKSDPSLHGTIHVSQNDMDYIRDSVARFCALSIAEAKEAYSDMLERRVKRQCFAGVYILEALEAVLGVDIIAGSKLGDISITAAHSIGGIGLEWVVGGAVWSVSSPRNIQIQWGKEGFELLADSNKKQRNTSSSFRWIKVILGVVIAVGLPAVITVLLE